MNVYRVATFATKEVEECIRKPGPANKLLSKYTAEDLKFVVLNLRQKYQTLLEKSKLFIWNRWICEANSLMNYNKR